MSSLATRISVLELKEVSFTIRKDGEEIPLVDRVSISVSRHCSRMP